MAVLQDRSRELPCKSCPAKAALQKLHHGFTLTALSEIYGVGVPGCLNIDGTMIRRCCAVRAQ